MKKITATAKGVGGGGSVPPPPPSPGDQSQGTDAAQEEGTGWPFVMTRRQDRGRWVVPVCLHRVPETDNPKFRRIKVAQNRILDRVAEVKNLEIPLKTGLDGANRLRLVTTVALCGEGENAKSC